MKKKTKFYVALVVAAQGRPSLRKYGDWASFIAPTEAEAVGAAVKAIGEWNAPGCGPNAPYECLVGEITGRVVVPTNYKVVKL